MAASYFTCFLLVVGLVPAMASPKVVEMQLSRGKSQAISKRGTGSVPLGNAVFNGLFYVNATVGTPPQPVQLQIDTGSSDVWVFDVNACQEVGCLGGSCKLPIFNDSAAIQFFASHFSTSLNICFRLGMLGWVLVPKSLPCLCRSLDQLWLRVKSQVKLYFPFDIRDCISAICDYVEIRVPLICRQLTLLNRHP